MVKGGDVVEKKPLIDIEPVVDDIALLGLDPVAPLEAEPLKIELIPPDIDIDLDVAPIDEPPTGLLLPEFDAESNEKFRKQIPFVKYTPYSLINVLEPLKSFDEFKADETITNLSDLVAAKSPKSIHCIILENLALNNKDLRELPSLINKYSELKALKLQGIGLKSADGIKLDKLRLCAIGNNMISDLRTVMRLVTNCPLLESLDCDGNPCVSKPRYRERLAASSPTTCLRVVNQRDLSVVERVNGVAAFGSRRQRHELEPLRFDLCFAALPAVQAMTTWQPELITDVDLRGNDLVVFHVGDLKNLRRLRLSRNKISNVRGMGLEQCSQLRRIELDHNALAKKDNLRVFRFMPGLAHVTLHDNAALGDYRLAVIAHTMFLVGTNRAPGLITLDNKRVSLNERIAAANERRKLPFTVEQFRWRLWLIQRYGHAQIRDKTFCPAVRVVAFPNKALSVVDLTSFSALVVLDLSGNNVVSVPGLDKLHQLRVLNLADNPKLKLTAALQQLHACTTLEQVEFAVNIDGHKRSPGSPKYMLAVVMKLFNNQKLNFLDSNVLPLGVRVAAFRSLGASSDEAERYRWHLALNIAALTALERPLDDASLHPSCVNVGAQYATQDVTVLRMPQQSLRSGFVDLAPFAALCELGLAGNRLTTLDGLGLASLPGLTRLDAHNNLIKQAPRELAALIDSCAALESLTLRGNPCMQRDQDRMQLLGLLKSLRLPDCNLKVLDVPITVAQRVEAWCRYGGGSQSAANALRLPALLALRVPSGSEARAALTRVDLSDAGLDQLDVREFVNVEHLAMAGNRLPSLARVVGLQDLERLRTLNVARNALSSVDEVARLLAFTSLFAIGVVGNPLCDVKHWRAKLVSQLPQLLDGTCKLRAIDEKPLTPAEICAAHPKSAGKDLDAFRFRIAISRQMPSGQTLATVTELDLSHSALKLKSVDLTQLRAIRKLSLAYNSLQSKHLSKCRLTALVTLTDLDLSFNQVSSIKLMGALLERLPQLVNFALAGNPCYPNSGVDTVRLSQLLTSSPRSLHHKSALRSINGLAIPASFRVETAKRVLGVPAADQLATALALADKPPASTHTLQLVGLGLTVVGRLARYRALHVLVLRDNQIRILPPELFVNMPLLRKVDLRRNLIQSPLDAVVSALALAPALRSLYLHECTADRRLTSDIDDYAPQVMAVLPNLVHIDGIPNPHGPPQKPVRAPVQPSAPRLSASDLHDMDAAAVNNDNEHDDDDDNDDDDDDDDDDGTTGDQIKRRRTRKWERRYTRRYSALNLDVDDFSPNTSDREQKQAPPGMSPSDVLQLPVNAAPYVDPIDAAPLPLLGGDASAPPATMDIGAAARVPSAAPTKPQRSHNMSQYQSVPRLPSNNARSRLAAGPLKPSPTVPRKVAAAPAVVVDPDDSIAAVAELSDDDSTYDSQYGGDAGLMNALIPVTEPEEYSSESLSEEIDANIPEPNDSDDAEENADDVADKANVDDDDDDESDEVDFDELDDFDLDTDDDDFDLPPPEFDEELGEAAAAAAAVEPMVRTLSAAEVAAAVELPDVDSDFDDDTDSDDIPLPDADDLHDEYDDGSSYDDSDSDDDDVEPPSLDDQATPPPTDDATDDDNDAAGNSTDDNTTDNKADAPASDDTTPLAQINANSPDKQSSKSDADNDGDGTNDKNDDEEDSEGVGSYLPPDFQSSVYLRTRSVQHGESAPDLDAADDLEDDLRMFADDDDDDDDDSDDDTDSDSDDNNEDVSDKSNDNDKQTTVSTPNNDDATPAASISNANETIDNQDVDRNNADDDDELDSDGNPLYDDDDVVDDSNVVYDDPPPPFDPSVVTATTAIITSDSPTTNETQPSTNIGLPPLPAVPSVGAVSPRADETGPLPSLPQIMASQPTAPPTDNTTHTNVDSQQPQHADEQQLASDPANNNVANKDDDNDDGDDDDDLAEIDLDKIDEQSLLERGVTSKLDQILGAIELSDDDESE